jgi:ABC-type sugar transport system ATPase subunit
MEQEKRETDRRVAVGHTWDDILEVADRLTHIVQTGRYVSKEQMQEVDREVRGPRGFLQL